MMTTQQLADFEREFAALCEKFSILNAVGVAETTDSAICFGKLPVQTCFAAYAAAVLLRKAYP